MENQQSLFIIGSPRSGTTMLQVLLASHPQVATTVELSLFDQYAGTWLKNWSVEKRNMAEKGHQRGLPMLWDEGELEAFLREFLDRIYSRVLARLPGRTHLLDKNPGYSLHVDIIKRLVPRARFVHVLRDGRDVACSLVAAQAMGFGAAGLAKAGAIWRNHVEGALKAKAYGADYLEVRYEEFLGENKRERYREVLEFCGLPAELAWIDQILEENTFEKMKSRRATGDPNVKSFRAHYRKGQAGGWQEEFTPWDRYEFSRTAGDLLCRLGYAEPGWWAENATERWLFPFRGEAQRRRKIIGLALTLLRRGVLGQRLPDGYSYFER